MLIVHSYGLAVALCSVTMLCWGSWANTQKLASKDWRFQLFYWDYAIGVFLFALLLAFTAGSTHVLAVDWTNLGGAYGLTVTWRPPDDTVFTPIPPYLTHPVDA